MASYVGIDVAKRKHQVACMDEAGGLLSRPFSVANDREGFTALQGRLMSLSDPVEIGLEATGHYWLALYDYLSRAGYSVHVLNPLQVHAYQRSGIRKRKTDKIDAVWIADFVRIGGATKATSPDSLRAYMQLRQLGRFRMSLAEQIGECKRRTLSVLDRIFPEYETLFSSVFISSSRALLAQALTPSEFAGFDLEELSALLRRASRGMLGRQRAQELKGLAAHSIGVSFLANAARVQVSCLLSQIEFLEGQLAQVDDALAELLSPLPKQYLTTIPGVGPVGAAVIIGEIGDVERFPSVEKLVAYSGLDPATHESGQFQAGSVHMSKRGSPYLRQALWLAAGVARQHDPDLKAYFDKRRAEGKPYNVILGAICHKLLKRVYVVLRDSRPYLPQLPNSPA